MLSNSWEKSDEAPGFLQGIAFATVVYLAVQSWRQLTRPTRKSNPFASRSMNVRIDDYLWLP